MPDLQRTEGRTAVGTRSIAVGVGNSRKAAAEKAHGRKDPREEDTDPAEEGSVLGRKSIFRAGEEVGWKRKDTRRAGGERSWEEMAQSCKMGRGGSTTRGRLEPTARRGDDAGGVAECPFGCRWTSVGLAEGHVGLRS